jgi:hypothetical protein
MCDLLGMDSWSVTFRFSGDNNNKVTIAVNFNNSVALKHADLPGGSTTINGTAQ